MDGHLKPVEKQRILDLYEGRLAKYGHDVRTVGWGAKADQWLRFSVLCRSLDLTGKSILDVGCGLGDFVAFLENSGITGYSYIGIDLSKPLIVEAERIYGGEGRKFVAGDLLDDIDLGMFDVVLCSGALSFRVSDNMAFARSMMEKMVALSRQVVSVNFLTSRVDYQLEKNFHYEPEVRPRLGFGGNRRTGALRPDQM